MTAENTTNTTDSAPHLPEYNGWPNKPTWAVALWIDNEQRTQETARGIVRGAHVLHEREKGLAALSPDPNADLFVVSWQQTAAQAFKDWIADAANPLAESANLYTDLLGWALSYVDWRHLAEHYDEQVQAADRYDEDNPS